MTQYDCIVIGFGGVGSAALYHAAKKGWRVLGIDQFGPVHNLGSSHGQSRIIRQAYFEHPNYVPLAIESLHRWEELNKRHRTRPEIKPLYERCGVLQIGRPESEVICGVQRSALEHDLQLESFTPQQMMQRLPLLNVDAEHLGLFEPDAGILRVEMCVTAHLAQAKKHGAELLGETPVESWSSMGDRVEVQTREETFSAKQLVIAAGPWSQKLLGFELDLNVVAKQQNWFQIDRVEQKLVNDFPAVFVEQNDGEQFYCIPEIDSLGMKVCRHTGGQSVDPSAVQRELDREDLELNEAFMDQFLVHTKRRLVHHSMCMYTMSPDGHFVVDHHPQHENVVFAAGLSGHGFKFAPVLGHRLIEMLDGQRDPQLEFLSLSRLA